jgi:subtilisin-like proprotein convertase family protein
MNARYWQYLLLTGALLCGLVCTPGRAAERNPFDEVMFFEDFEHISQGSVPEPWISYDEDGGYCTWFGRNSVWEVFARENFPAHSGQRFLMCHFNDFSVPNDDWIVLPPQYLGVPMSIHYWVAAQDYDYPESYEVRVSTGGNSPAEFTHVVFRDTAVTDLWSERNHDLAAFSGLPIWIAFHYNAVNRFVLKLDDISVEGTSLYSGVIAGTVFDSVNHGLDDVHLTVQDLNQEAWTDSAGAYRIEHISPGMHTLLVQREFYNDALFDGVVTANDSVTHLNVAMERLPLRFYDWVSTGSQGHILDNDTAIMTMWPRIADTLVIWDLETTISIEHPNIGDLDIWLRSPDLVSVPLVAHDPFHTGTNILQCRFDDEARQPFTAGQAPFRGTFRPASPLSQFDGDSMIALRGGHLWNNWTLVVRDNNAGDEGWIRGFSLHAAVQDPVPVTETHRPLPTSFSFEGNYPNPFNGETRFRFALARDGWVQLTLYDVLGRDVAHVLDEPLRGGMHEVRYDARGLPSGVYWARIKMEGAVQTKKIILLK